MDRDRDPKSRGPPRVNPKPCVNPPPSTGGIEYHTRLLQAYRGLINTILRGSYCRGIGGTGLS